MMDVSKIYGETITCLANIYSQAITIFGVEPTQATEKQQEKIRKWICRERIYLKGELPKEVNIFSSQYSDKDVLIFLKECYDIERKIEEEKLNKIDKDFADFDKETKAALKHLLVFEFMPQIEQVGNDIKLMLQDNSAFKRVLTLKNADGISKDIEGCFCNNLNIFLNQGTQKFCFCGEIEELFEDTSSLFAITFENAQVDVQTFNACKGVEFFENPWNYLRDICFFIGMKANLPGNYLNQKEKELLPLIKEIVALEYWMRDYQQEYLSFKNLKKLTQKYSYNKATALLEKLETFKPGDTSFYNFVKKLFNTLCKKECEPLWREIYNKISDSQEEFPNKTDLICDKEILTNLRNNIQQLMESKGYIGTYPDFVMDGILKGIHLESSYDRTYFVGIEKRAQYHIHCTEFLSENKYISVQFICGTALLKKDEEETDIYGCLFNSKGRRLFHTVGHYTPLKESEETETDNLETSVTIATKKAECIPLNKTEKKAFYGSDLPGWGLFWWIFLIGGGLFSIAMTLIMMIISIIVTICFGLCFGLYANIPEMLLSIPWWLISAISWIGFGGLFALTEVLSKRK